MLLAMRSISIKVAEEEHDHSTVFIIRENVMINSEFNKHRLLFLISSKILRYGIVSFVSKVQWWMPTSDFEYLDL